MFSRFIHIVTTVLCPFCGWRIFLCMDIPQFIYPFTSWRAFPLPHPDLLAIVNNASMNICVQVFKSTYVLISFGINLGLELLGHMITWYLTFWGTSKLFSKVATPCYIPINSVYSCKHLSLSVFCILTSLWLLFAFT